MVMYFPWNSLTDDDDHLEKPRRYGVTEMRITDPDFLLNNHHNQLQTAEGSRSLIPKDFIKEITDLARRHGIYVSIGDWAEHMLQECKSLGFDTVELNARSLKVPEDSLLRFIRLIKTGGLKVKPLFSVKFNRFELPVARNKILELT